MQFKVLRPTIEQNIDSLNLNIIKNCLCINVYHLIGLKSHRVITGKTTGIEFY